jgi:hypothetical protein
MIALESRKHGSSLPVFRRDHGGAMAETDLLVEKPIAENNHEEEQQ